MRRLNKSRVALKHHGTMPSIIDIEAFRASSTNFFTENTPKIFDIDFDLLSMVDLVKCTESRKSLKEADKLREKGHREEALDKVAIAFSQLIDDYENRKRSRFGRSPFFFGRSLTFESSHFMGLKGKLANFVDKTKESIEAMQDAIKVISLGLDYRRYVKFKQIIPVILRVVGGSYNIQRIRDVLLNVEDYQFCYDFVIDSALRLQEFDFDVTKNRE